MHRLLQLLLLIVLTVIIGHAQETILETLLQDCDLIVHGHIRSKMGSWAGDRKGIITQVTVEVKEMLRGNQGRQSVVFEILGGRVGDSELRIIPSIPFVEGEEVVLFLFSEQRLGTQVCHVHPYGKLLVSSPTRSNKKFLAWDPAYHLPTRSGSIPVSIDSLRVLAHDGGIGAGR